MVQPGGGRGQRQCAGDLPRRRRLAVRLRGEDRQAALEVRLQSQESRLQARRPRRHAITSSPRRSSGTTSSTSASASNPTTAPASAICGASTSPRSRRTRTRICRRSTTTSIRKRQVNKDSGLVWHYGGTGHAAAGRTGPRVHLRPHDQHRGHPRRPGLRRRAGRLPALPRRQDRQETLGARPERRTPGARRYYVDGKVYMGTDDGDLFVFQHGKEQKKPTKIDMQRCAQECRPWRSTACCTSATARTCTPLPRSKTIRPACQCQQAAAPC